MEKGKFGDVGAIAELIPWSITGLLVLVGALTVAIYGLPFESKSDGERTTAQIAEVTKTVGQLASVVNQVQRDEAVLGETVKNLAEHEAEITDLRKTVELQALHIEGLEADEKANDSERLAHEAAHPRRR